VIAFPPNYQVPSQAFENRIRQLSRDYAHFCHYDAENPIYKDKDNFYDTEHLMRETAGIYTGEVIDFLRTLKP